MRRSFLWSSVRIGRKEFFKPKNKVTLVVKALLIVLWTFSSFRKNVINQKFPVYVCMCVWRANYLRENYWRFKRRPRSSSQPADVRNGGNSGGIRASLTWWLMFICVVQTVNVCVGVIRIMIAHRPERSTAVAAALSLSLSGYVLCLQNDWFILLITINHLYVIKDCVDVLKIWDMRFIDMRFVDKWFS